MSLYFASLWVYFVALLMVCKANNLTKTNSHANNTDAPLFSNEVSLYFKVQDSSPRATVKSNSSILHVMDNGELHFRLNPQKDYLDKLACWIKGYLNERNKGYTGEFALAYCEKLDCSRKFISYFSRDFNPSTYAFMARSDTTDWVIKVKCMDLSESTGARKEQTFSGNVKLYLRTHLRSKLSPSEILATRNDESYLKFIIQEIKRANHNGGARQVVEGQKTIMHIDSELNVQYPLRKTTIFNYMQFPQANVRAIDSGSSLFLNLIRLNALDIVPLPHTSNNQIPYLLKLQPNQFEWEIYVNEKVGTEFYCSVTTTINYEPNVFEKNKKPENLPKELLALEFTTKRPLMFTHTLFSGIYSGLYPYVFYNASMDFHFECTSKSVHPGFDTFDYKFNVKLDTDSFIRSSHVVGNYSSDEYNEMRADVASKKFYMVPLIYWPPKNTTNVNPALTKASRPSS